ncbi:MAG TPA: SDR family oxidoreductase [Terriglobia bacterium]|nr:SDR family oxidoreductase [Terriglobia bacterium]
MIDPGLRNRVVLVTGGNNPHGIGAATAKACALHGAAVFIHYFRMPTPEFAEAAGPSAPAGPSVGFYYSMQQHSAQEVVSAIRAAGGRAEAWEADLADPTAIPQLFDRAEQALGPVEVLVNNAATDEFDTFLPAKSSTQGDRSDATGLPIETVTVASHDRSFAVNSRAVALLMAEFARRQIASGRRWGRVINVSTDGASGYPSNVSYWASKHAMESFSRAAAAELGPFGITVNVVSPGPIQTGWISPDLEAKILPNIPLRRVGQPEDIADAIVFFASQQACWITGQLLYVGGGNRMHQ